MYRAFLMIAWREAVSQRPFLVVSALCLPLSMGLDAGLKRMTEGGDDGMFVALWCGAVIFLVTLSLLISTPSDSEASFRFPTHYAHLPLRTVPLATMVFLARVCLFAAVFVVCMLVARTWYGARDVLDIFLAEPIRQQGPFLWRWQFVGAFALLLGVCWMSRSGIWTVLVAFALFLIPSPDEGTRQFLFLAFPVVGLFLGIRGACRSRCNAGERAPSSCGRSWTTGRTREFPSPIAAQRWLECQRVLRGWGALFMFGLPALKGIPALIALFIVEFIYEHELGPLPPVARLSACVLSLGTFVVCAPAAMLFPINKAGLGTRRFAMLRPCSNWTLVRARFGAAARLSAVWVPIALLAAYYAGIQAAQTEFVSSSDTLFFSAAMSVVLLGMLWAGNWGSVFLVGVPVPFAVSLEIGLGIPMEIGYLLLLVALTFGVYLWARMRRALVGSPENLFWVALATGLIFGAIVWFRWLQKADYYPFAMIGAFTAYIALPFIVAPLETHLRRHR